MNYLMRRLAAFPLVLLGVSILVFVAIRMVPGDSITAMLGTEAGLLTPAQRDSLAAYFGIDQPWFVQYWRWIGGILHGNFGISVTYGRPVLDVILERFPLTLELALLSMIIALAVGMPAGIYAATHNEKASDLGVRIVAMSWALACIPLPRRNAASGSRRWRTERPARRSMRRASRAASSTA